MKRFTRTLRFRLTAWYGFAMALGLGVFILVLLGLAERHLLHTHDEAMAFKAKAAMFILEQQSPGPELSQVHLEHLARLGRVIVFQVDQGVPRVLYRPPDLFHGPVLERSVIDKGEPDGRPVFATVIDKGNYWRILTLQYRGRDGRIWMIRTLEDLGDVKGSLHRLKLAFFHLAPLGVIVSLLGGFVLSTRALAPVSNIIDLAHRFDPKQLWHRIPHPGVDDEIGRLVDTLNMMLGRIEAYFEAVKRFTADASHELRSPLAIIRNTIDVTLEKSRTREELEQSLQSLGEEVDRIRTLVEDLLLLARADSGRVVMQMAPVSLAFLLEAQVEAYQPQAQARNIRLVMGPLLPDEVQGNERWLLQVVGNLLGNAINYTPSGGTVIVAMARTEESICFSVSDTGPGIPEEDLERVFERFFRSDPARSRGHVQGQGLGLAIVAWVVGEHGGTVRASNRPEGGATFQVTLPLGPS